MTPYELSLVCEAFNEKSEAESQEKIILTWLSEYYHRQKKLPSLKKALEDFFGKKEEVMTDEQMLEMAKRLNAQFGGTFEDGGKNDK